MNFKEKLKKKAENIGIALNELQLQQFQDFYELLIEKNKVMNLTSITEEDEVIDKHFIDSLTCNRVIDMNQVKSVIDIGTGAGFPGIPLKIVYPDIDFVLLDSLNKRVRFLNEAIELLHLKKIQAVHGRAEDLARKPEFRGKFDLCVSRAVANLNTLSEYCIPFVRVNGFFISYKAQKGLEEIHESDHCMKELGSKIMQVDEFKLTDIDSNRVLIKIKKCKGTSKLYPRKAGIPSKNPL
ncbi:MAG: 16S rRNA (guanine(527)-N(7))-methyltransferase RsmG [Anaerobutyricum sp.]|nr:16S rRNA (guanine(527)-N(7))-methyltransferase RsmG [Eubacterium sp.]MDY6045575.1 16S rRNA (guanine(527)-N(7))-methyltransferase RsmG [Anaerobutyricum sp.]